ncbi:hypothetical protein BaRGS_00008915 [Batillaria attramentaria]|uniref:Activation-induced cytidine deaminase AID domain-containing protein n=1 Tax=Batillaria attramentaria TaxID=370345 RepID=A0ABD0LLF1_9CAEN
MAAAEDNTSTIFVTFLTTMLHEGADVKGWVTLPQNAYAITHIRCGISPNKSTWFLHESAGQHAERNMVDELTREYLTNTSDDTDKPFLRIAMYVNYSPCNGDSNCAAAVKEFHEKASEKYEVSMEMVFVGLYYIRRPSCYYNGQEGAPTRPCTHYSLRLSEDESRQHISGLRTLRDAGINLRTFEDRDWETLINYLVIERDGDRSELQGQMDEARDRRRKEDEYMRQDFEAIFGGEFE